MFRLGLGRCAHLLFREETKEISLLFSQVVSNTYVTSDSQIFKHALDKCPTEEPASWKQYGLGSQTDLQLSPDSYTRAYTDQVSSHDLLEPQFLHLYNTEGLCYRLL